MDVLFSLESYFSSLFNHLGQKRPKNTIFIFLNWSRMKKLYILLISVLIGVANSLTAQTVIDPNPVQLNDLDVSIPDIVAYSTVTNESTFNVNYEWVRTEIEITEGWTSAVCDKNQCYLYFVDSQEFSLAPGEEGTLDVHIYPDNIEGAAIIEVKVTDISNPDNTDTGLYLFNNTLGTAERLTNAIKIYPNPAPNELFIENPVEVELIEFYDIRGKLHLSSQVNGSMSIDISSLSSGNYIVRMWNENNDQVSTNLLMKQ